MKKIVLYDPGGKMDFAVQVLRQRKTEEGCSFNCFHKTEKMLFYLEEIGWDMDILVFSTGEIFEKDMELICLCRRRAKWMKLLLAVELPVDTNIFCKYHPDGIITLPSDKEQFVKTMEFLEKAVDEEYNCCLTITVKGKMYRLPFKEIVFIESEGHQIIIKTVGEEIRFYGKLDDMLLKLPLSFRRCHQSYLVNLHYVRQLEMYKVKLHGNNQWIPVSQKYYKEMRSILSFAEKSSMIDNTKSRKEKSEEQI